MPKILVVDDIPVDRCLVQGILEQDTTIQVESADNGQVALDLVENIEDKIDLVVTDLNMPEMDGLQLVTQMRVHHPEIPVVLTTANGSEDLAIGALDQGRGQLRSEIMPCRKSCSTRSTKSCRLLLPSKVIAIWARA